MPWGKIASNTDSRRDATVAPLWKPNNSQSKYLMKSVIKVYGVLVVFQLNAATVVLTVIMVIFAIINEQT
jgi:hypothetical protein